MMMQNIEAIIKENACRLSLTIPELLAAIENGAITAELKERPITEIDIIEIEPYRRSRKFNYDLDLERFLLDNEGEPETFAHDYFDELERLHSLFRRFENSPATRETNKHANTEDWRAFIMLHPEYE